MECLNFELGRTDHYFDTMVYMHERESESERESGNEREMKSYIYRKGKGINTI